MVAHFRLALNSDDLTKKKGTVNSLKFFVFSSTETLLVVNAQSVIARNNLMLS